ncbi:MAG TPA: lamin tail domain-containing protein [Pyrinomonadaceae bacterium]|jgi:hypothetical protein
MRNSLRTPSPLFYAAVFAAFVFVGAAETSAQLVISEFRVRGPNGANDEFIEIYNNSGADHTVNSTVPTSTGYGVYASDGVLRCRIPNGTVIPNRGHYLCVNSVGYSLASYPAGNGTTATGDATYTLKRHGHTRHAARQRRDPRHALPARHPADRQLQVLHQRRGAAVKE